MYYSLVVRNKIVDAIWKVNVWTFIVEVNVFMLGLVNVDLKHTLPKEYKQKIVLNALMVAFDFAHYFKDMV